MLHLKDTFHLDAEHRPRTHQASFERRGQAWRENDELDHVETNGFLIYEQNWRELATPVPTRERIADR